MLRRLRLMNYGVGEHEHETGNWALPGLYRIELLWS